MIVDFILAGCGLGFALVGIYGAIDGDANNKPANVILGFLLWVVGLFLCLVALRWGMA